MKTALVEIENSHAECLYSQIEFLKKTGHHVTVVSTKEIKKIIDNFNNIDLIKEFDFNGNKFQNTIQLFKLHQFLNKNFDYVIFNTCSGNKIRNLCLLPLKKPKLAGIIHNTKKIYTSSNQKIISKKIKNYFVLNDELLKHIKTNNSLKFSSFYPIFFPEFKTIPLNKKQNEIWITIPGQIEQSRRNYQFIIDTLKNNTIDSTIKFIFLGRISKKDFNNPKYITLINDIKYFHEKGKLLCFENFIDENIFHSYLKKSDFIMPLLNSENNEAYKKYKISGTNNLAFAYKKPLLVHENFIDFDDFKENATFYNNNTFINLLNNLKEIQNINLYKNKKWQFDYQKNRYLNFIKG